ncbi:uncharacterized protein LOC125855610 [Solanum stenotomum]|uniref:uncharacterized protein LOC125855610 n=1 Tax=Solanum stenotomum TaxID=172797 RepID=UPI0020D1A4AB|nr:uncharacterized protein LOC125855610 [Solanum stenotomum]
MNTRANPRRVEEKNVNEGVPPQGEQGLQGGQVPIGNQGNNVLVVPPDMTNEEIRVALLALARAMTGQANKDVGPRLNESTLASRRRDFVWMNPPIFLSSRIGEDPQELLDEIYKIVDPMGVSSREKVELASDQLKEVPQIWFTLWKANRPVEAGPIEWDEFKRTFLSKYFPREKRQVKIEEFINLSQGNMNVEEDEINRFVTGISDLVKEECHTTILHEDMNICRLMVYAQSIEESKLNRMNMDLKRGRLNEKDQPRFKKRAPNQDSTSASKANEDKGGGSQFSKPLCATCGKKHFGKCLDSMSGCYGCGKNDHKVRDCPTLTARGRNAKQASIDVPNLDASKWNRSYALLANQEANPDEGAGKL